MSTDQEYETEADVGRTMDPASSMALPEAARAAFQVPRDVMNATYVLQNVDFRESEAQDKLEYG